MEILAPHLPHNREESSRLRRRKWQSTAGLVVLGTVLVPALPNAIFEEVAVIWLIASLAIIGYFDLQRHKVFRRDVRERQSLQPPAK